MRMKPTKKLHYEKTKGSDDESITLNFIVFRFVDSYKQSSR